MNAPARLAVIGGGPAGLMAAEAARACGVDVDLFDRMGSVGRKFLLAGKGGLNLTHAEPFEAFVSRYRERSGDIETWLRAFDADALRAWARELGVDTFVGTSDRVFPSDRKAAPLLRSWVRRLRAQGVRFRVQHRWTGLDAAADRAHLLAFESPEGTVRERFDAVVFALGGASWPALGSDGAWVEPLAALGAAITRLQPSNCGFDVAWSGHFASRHAGQPVKPVAVRMTDRRGREHTRQGEFVVTTTGVEGSLIYALSAELRDVVSACGSVTLHLDLAPGRSAEDLATILARDRKGRSLSEHLRRSVHLDGVRAGLLFEHLQPEERDDPARLAARIKSIPLHLQHARPVAEAISTAGGVRLDALDEHLMLRARPGVFCAGEMLDWEAPTGGYLLTACFASGRIAGHAAATWAKTPATR